MLLRCVKSALAVLLSACLGYSCQKGAEERLFDMFGGAEHIAGTELPVVNDSIGDPYLMTANSGRIFFVDINTPYNVTAIGMSDGSVQRAVSRGRGPGEVLWVTTISVDEAVFTLYDGNMRSVFKYPLGAGRIGVGNNEVEAIRLDSSAEAAFKAEGLADGYLATGVTHDLRQFIEYDSGGAVVRTFEEYPADPQYSGPRESIPFGYQGQISPADDMNGFAWSGVNGIIFKFFIAGDGGFEKVREYVYEHPRFIGRHDNVGTGAMFEIGNRAGTISAKSSGGNYYFLYSGSVHTKNSTYVDAISGDDVLVFDRFGEPVKHYKLDRLVRLFDVDASGGRLICYAVNPESGLPEMFSYQLK